MYIYERVAEAGDVSRTKAVSKRCLTERRAVKCFDEAVVNMQFAACRREQRTRDSAPWDVSCHEGRPVQPKKTEAREARWQDCG